MELPVFATLYFFKTYTNGPNKLECLSLVSLYSQCFRARLGVYPSVEHLKGADLSSLEPYSKVLG
jgi:hypothetical protein